MQIEITIGPIQKNLIPPIRFVLIMLYPPLPYAKSLQCESILIKADC